jgi:small-conductance mechanosensitive channel
MIADYLTNKFGAAGRLLLSNSLADWLIAAAIAVSIWSVLWILRRLIASRYERRASAEHPGLIRLFAYLIGNTKQFFFFAIALSVASESLTLPDRLHHILENVVLVLILLQVGLWAGRAVRFYLDRKELERGGQPFAGSLDIIRFVAGILIWSLVILVTLENLGVNITALIAGLGVGGVAVALALQNVLGDLFASLSIALDKPFSVGDSLVIDTFSGNVERIGIKTTRLRSVTGEQIILSNADILKSRVRNFGRAAEQRALVTLRVNYDTPADKLREIPKLVEGIVREQANARFERCHLLAIGESAAQFELSYFVQQPKLNSLFELQQAVNFRIIEEFKRAGVEFANTTQRVLLAQGPPAK